MRVAQWFVANCDSKPCGVTRRGGNIVPALLIGPSAGYRRPVRRGERPHRVQIGEVQRRNRRPRRLRGPDPGDRVVAVAWLQEAITTRPPWAASCQAGLEPEAAAGAGRDEGPPDWSAIRSAVQRSIEDSSFVDTLRYPLRPRAFTMVMPGDGGWHGDQGR